MDRKAEVRELLKLSPEEVQERAGERLVVCGDLETMHRRFAQDLAQEIAQSHAEGRPCRLIVPVGPVGQYPILLDTIVREGLSLEHCWFFFMDEYCDEAGNVLPIEHPLSLRRHARHVFLDKLDRACGLKPEQVVFPSETNIDVLAQMIEEGGGIDVCYGGVGIHGHIAFNEPEPGVSELGPRRVRLNDFTVTMNAIRAGVGGNLECFPRHAYTLGMREILHARTIRLYIRCGYEIDWANAVLRLALFGAPGDDYPVTHIRNRNYVIATDYQTLASPENLI